MCHRITYLNVKEYKIVIIFLAIFAINCLVLTSCKNSNALVEINRCLFINQKIDEAKTQLDDLDLQMAEYYNDPIFEVGTEIYNFYLANGRILKTMVFYPKSKADPSPVVIFSHGFSGSAESQLYLTRGLARRGNIVIAPDHLDEISFDRIGLLDDELKNGKSTDIVRALNHIIINLIKNEAGGTLDFMDDLDSLSEEEMQIMINSGELLNSFNSYFSYRIDDIKFLLDQLSYLNDFDAILRGKIDFDRLIMAGHSLGGSTALCLAINDNPFQAFICLSPAVEPFAQDNLRLINKPILYMSGDLDDFYNDTLMVFNYARPPKMFLSIKDGGHIIFIDRIFLYGLGIPFISDGEVGFADNFTGNKIDIIPFVANYPEQLHNYQNKAVIITQAVSAFIDLYVNGNDRASGILLSLEDNSLIDEFIFYP